MISIPENASPGTRLIRMEASDTDINSRLVYFLASNSSLMRAFDENNNRVNAKLVADWFSIDVNSGDIFVASSNHRGHLDRELAEFVHLVVGVEDVNASEHFRPQIVTSKR